MAKTNQPKKAVATLIKKLAGKEAAAELANLATLAQETDRKAAAKAGKNEKE